MGLINRLTVFFVFATGFLSGQTVLHTTHDTTSQPKEHVKVSVINPHGKQPVEYSGHAIHSDSVQQALKLNPLNFLRGEFAAYYEMRISDGFSVEAGGGVTYIDYLYEMIANGGQYLSFGQLSKPPVKFYSGFSGHFQFRWYPSKYETAITGYYFAPELSYKNYKMDYFVYTGLISEPRRTERKWTDLKLQFGYQNADPYENVFWDWYVSVGVRHYNETYLNGTGFEAALMKDKYWGPVIGGGVKIGFTL